METKQILDNLQACACNYHIDAIDNPGFSLETINPLRHNYHQHPLLQMDNLSALAKRLVVSDQCRFIARDTKADSVFDHKKQSLDGWGIEEVFQHIDEPGSWVAINNVQTDALYHQFIMDMMPSVQHLIPHYDQVFDVRAYLFISSPPSITPFHIDTENNFWLQIHGRKTIHLWDRHNTEVLPTRAVEKFVINGGDLSMVILKKEHMSHSIAFNAGPGDGVYFPSTTPHMTRSDTSWVNPDDKVSVSLALTFYNESTKRTAYVHTVNDYMRRIGLKPLPPRQSHTIDALKYPAGQLLVEMKRLLRHYSVPRGF